VVLETLATASKKEPTVPEVPLPVPAEQKIIWHETKKPRPRSLKGVTYNVDTPLGKAFVTVNANGGNQPFEVFVNTAKAGSDTAAVSEAIGRLISYILRLASPIAPIDRLREIVTQLTGIGAGRSLGFGPQRVRSLPDGVGQVISEYIRGWQSEPDDKSVPGSAIVLNTASKSKNHSNKTHHQKFGDLCPECGEATVVNEEGCRKCYSCGYSEC